MTALHVADVDLSPRAEDRFRREAERCGGLAIDPDTAVQASAALNLLSDVRVVLVAAEGAAR